jgi:hypothetical protein
MVDLILDRETLESRLGLKILRPLKFREVSLGWYGIENASPDADKAMLQKAEEQKCLFVYKELQHLGEAPGIKYTGYAPRSLRQK